MEPSIARAATLVVLAGLASGCKAPPEAPTQLEELSGYLFEHAWDEDTLELEAGVLNLDTWLKTGTNLESTLEGYQITAMTQESVDAIDDSDRSVDALVGAAVAAEHTFDAGEVSQAIVVEDQMEVFPKNYKDYSRTYSDDPTCFPGIDCLSLTADSSSESSWAGLITVKSDNHIQYRWLEVEDVGWVVVHRSWLKEPAEVSLAGIDVFAQYFLAVTVPRGDGSLRLMATWIDSDYGALPVSEDFAKSQIVNSMQKQGEDVEEFLGAD